MCRSNGLERVDRIKIGLNLFGSVRSLILGKGMTFAFLKGTGKVLC